MSLAKLEKQSSRPEVAVRLRKVETFQDRKPVYEAQIRSSKSVQLLSTNFIDGRPVVRLEVPNKIKPENIVFYVQRLPYISEVRCISNGIFEFILAATEATYEDSTIFLNNVLDRYVDKRDEAEEFTAEESAEIDEQRFMEFTPLAVVREVSGKEVQREFLQADVIPYFGPLPSQVEVSAVFRYKTGVEGKGVIASSKAIMSGEIQNIPLELPWSQLHAKQADCELVIKVTNLGSAEVLSEIIDCKKVIGIPERSVEVEPVAAVA